MAHSLDRFPCPQAGTQRHRAGVLFRRTPARCTLATISGVPTGPALFLPWEADPRGGGPQLRNQPGPVGLP